MLHSRPRAELVSGSGSGRRAVSCRTSSGFSFVEVLLATLIIGSVLTAAMTSLSGAAKTQATLASGPTTALSLANEIHTLALALPRGAGDGSPAHAGSEVVAIGDLDGASFSPPIDARKSSLAASTGWSQAVSVDTVALAAPGVTDDARTGADRLLKLTVTVRQGSTAAGTYTWWINP